MKTIPGLALMLCVFVSPVIADDAEERTAETPSAESEATAGLECRNRTLDACTRARVQALERLSREFRSQSKRRASHPTDPFGVPDRDEWELDRWLEAWSREAGALASDGERVVAAEGNGGDWLRRSFNLRYLSFRDRVREDSHMQAYGSEEARRRQNSIRSELSRLP